MSWKVYEGIKIDGVASIEDAQAFVNNLRKPIINILQAEIAKQIKQLACLIYDMHHSFGVNMFDEKESDRKPLLVATMRIVVDAPRDEDTVYSIGITSIDGITVGIPFFLNNRECREYLIALPNVHAFGFWDNTDPDKNVSKSEWKLRERTWKKVFDTCSTPAEAMFIQNLADTRMMIPPDELMKDVPDVESREKLCVQHLAMTRAVEKTKNDGTFKDTNFSVLMNAAEEMRPGIEEEVSGKLSPIKMKQLEKEIPKRKQSNGP